MRCKLKSIRIILLGALSLVSISCLVFPYNYKYYYLTYSNDPNVGHRKTAEYNSPPALIRFQYESIYYIAIIKDKNIFFGLEIPEGHTAQLLERQIK